MTTPENEPPTEPLKAGDQYPCPHCHQPRVVSQPYADRSTAERLFLYVVCGEKPYFVGQVVNALPNGR